MSRNIVKNTIPNLTKTFFFLFSEDNVNWKILSIFTDYQLFFKTILPKYLDRIGILNINDRNRIKNMLLQSNECIYSPFETYRITSTEINSIINTDKLDLQYQEIKENEED